jgi:hypothetical protein
MDKTVVYYAESLMPMPIQKGPFIFCPKSGRLIGIAPKYKFLKYAMPLIGLAALAWYLIRVLPKPSRAAYPCQQTAAPLAFGFLASFATAVVAFRKAKSFAWQRRFLLSAFCGLLAAIAAFTAVNYSTTSSTAMWTPSDAPNTFIGTPRGINPGRVVWARDPSAVKWDGKNGHWWDENASDQKKVDALLSASLQSLTSTPSDSAAWQALFTSYNKTHNQGSAGYTKGQKILIKINQNTGWDGHAENGDKRNQNSINGNPHLLLATIKTLVASGVDQDDITVYDLSRWITDSVYTLPHNAFPKVHWIEKDTGGGDGRDACPKENEWVKNAITFSDPSRALGRNLPQFIVDASYMINMSIMKNHGDQGATLAFKNHFGTIHGLNHDAISPKRMGESNPLVDLGAHKDLGEKTVLFMIDSLYGADGPDNPPRTWKIAPFNNAFPASVFVSQDGVAIESVGFDFINAEWGCKANTDNLMHEAALADNPPSGKKYGPVSLGVHEHWNNVNDKKYSRNLGTGKGLELTPIVLPRGPQG